MNHKQKPVLVFGKRPLDEWQRLVPNLRSSSFGSTTSILTALESGDKRRELARDLN